MPLSLDMLYFILLFFVAGYLMIIFEQRIKIDKAASALFVGVACWVIYAILSPSLIVHEVLMHHIAEIAGILFFLLGAMTIVELIDLHDGFAIISECIRTTQKSYFLLWIAAITFFLSALLDNLTTAIVMATVLMRLLPERNDRMYCLGMIVIAANAGGAWSPIGDVTTTMLWMGKQIEPWTLIKLVFLPSVISVFIPYLWILKSWKGTLVLQGQSVSETISHKHSNRMLLLGLSLLLSVPLFHQLTGLPPFLGMLFALSVLWICSEWMHRRQTTQTFDKAAIFVALERIDMPSLLFFLGILLAVSALSASGLLLAGAQSLSMIFPDHRVIFTGIGILSAVFDNVPLVAAMQGMYSLQAIQANDSLWHLLAYAAGTGGSLLLIGSAAGVAVMGIENISFRWYLQHITLAALLGYAGGIICFLLISL